MALFTLLGCIPPDILKAAALLYSRDDMEELVAAMPTFNECGLELHDHPNLPVVLSSGDSDGDEDSKGTEEEDLGRASAPLQCQLLLRVGDDDDADELPAAESPCPKQAECALPTTWAPGEPASGEVAATSPPKGPPCTTGVVKQAGLAP